MDIGSTNSVEARTADSDCCGTAGESDWSRAVDVISIDGNVVGMGINESGLVSETADVATVYSVETKKRES